MKKIINECRYVDKFTNKNGIYKKIRYKVEVIDKHGKLARYNWSIEEYNMFKNTLD